MTDAKPTPANAGKRKPKKPVRTTVPDSVFFANLFGWLSIVSGVIVGGMVGNAAANRMPADAAFAFMAAATPFFGAIVFGLMLILMGQVVKFLALILRKVEDATAADATPETKTPG